MMDKIKKVLVIDPLSPIGHKDINIFFLRSLKKYNVTYVSSKNYIDVPVFIKQIITIDEKWFHITNSGIINRINYYIILTKIFHIVDVEKYDKVVFMSYETISFSIFFFFNFIVRKKLKYSPILFNHNNVDELDKSIIKRLFFRAIPHSFIHVCYEKFIADFLTNQFGKKVWVVHHNLNYEKCFCSVQSNTNLRIRKESGGKLINVLIPSFNGINNSFIFQLDNYLEKNRGVLNRINIIIKYNSILPVSNIFLITHYLSQDEYSLLFKQSDIVVIPYDNTFYKYRVSGIFFDALSFSKPIIHKETAFFNNLPYSIGYKYDSVDDLFDILSSLTEETLHNFYNNINLLQEYYSDNIIITEIESLVDNRLI